MEQGLGRDRFRRLVRPTKAPADWFSRVLWVSLFTFIAIWFLHVGIAIYEEETKPLEVCGACLYNAANPNSHISICYLIPSNRTCPTCGREWRMRGSCVFTPWVEFVRDLTP